jgi:hypothetical protein
MNGDDGQQRHRRWVDCAVELSTRRKLSRSTFTIGGSSGALTSADAATGLGAAGKEQQEQTEAVVVKSTVSQGEMTAPRATLLGVVACQEDAETSTMAGIAWSSMALGEVAVSLYHDREQARLLHSSFRTRHAPPAGVVATLGGISSKNGRRTERKVVLNLLATPGDDSQCTQQQQRRQYEEEEEEEEEEDEELSASFAAVRVWEPHHALSRFVLEQCGAALCGKGRGRGRGLKRPRQEHDHGTAAAAAAAATAASPGGEGWCGRAQHSSCLPVRRGCTLLELGSGTGAVGLFASHGLRAVDQAEATSDQRQHGSPESGSLQCGGGGGGGDSINSLVVLAERCRRVLPLLQLNSELNRRPNVQVCRLRPATPPAVGEVLEMLEPVAAAATGAAVAAAAAAGTPRGVFMPSEFDVVVSVVDADATQSAMWGVARRLWATIDRYLGREPGCWCALSCTLPPELLQRGAEMLQAAAADTAAAAAAGKEEATWLNQHLRRGGSVAGRGDKTVAPPSATLPSLVSPALMPLVVAAQAHGFSLCNRDAGVTSTCGLAAAAVQLLVFCRADPQQGGAQTVWSGDRCDAHDGHLPQAFAEVAQRMPPLARAVLVDGVPPTAVDAHALLASLCLPPQLAAAAREILGGSGGVQPAAAAGYRRQHCLSADR